MAASVQCRPQERTLGMVMKEVDEDLAIFLQMRRSVKEREDHIHSGIFEEFNDSLFENSPADSTAKENFLSSENDTSDYDWLVSPPGAPSYPSLDEEENTVGKHSDSTESDSMPADSPKDLASQNSSSVGASTSSGKSTSSSSMNSSSSGNGRPASAGGRKSTASRSATPTGRPRVSSISKMSRPSTPTSRASLPSAKTTAAAAPGRTSSRSSTPAAPGRTSSRSSTPAARPSVPATSKSASRSATPTRSASSARSSSVAKTAPAKAKKPESARGPSPTVKSRPSSSQDAPKNSRASVMKRPVSASRGRPIAPHVRPSTTHTGSDGKPRHRSCSPSKGQIPIISIHSHWSGSLSRSRGYNNDEDDVNPVLMGTKMVERVVNMRKLAPPKPDDHQSSSKDSSKKSSISQKSSSFGTSFSKKSLDMAIRHMEIRRSSGDNANRAMKKGCPASSGNGVQANCSSKGKTSSNASPEPSINNGCHHGYESEVEGSNCGSESGLPSHHLQPSEK
ncbi:serine/arginine repetitive matrix protein 2-like isoform X2 [Ipomoea triloba]|uniref:serine/arginine repetitive matrix protein 2-like isoform X2 n=1 Tax=Ipomoea triloba TaxID=35885 RepID=UPI00125E8992|nr:serine/arginine repetitive matrix protein 2-like isoform X2 [Ipomoea triloba]